MPEELGGSFPLLLGLSVPVTVSFGSYFYFLSIYKGLEFCFACKLAHLRGYKGLAFRSQQSEIDTQNLIYVRRTDYYLARIGKVKKRKK